MINGAVLLEAINDIANEKGIEKAVVIEGIKEGFQKAFERFFDTEAKVNVEINEKAGTLKMYQEYEVVKEVEDDWLEVDLKTGQKLGGENVKIGDVVNKEILFDEEFSRLAVFQVRQILQQKIKGAERTKIYEKFIGQEHEVLRAKVTGMNEQGNSYLIDIEGTQASLWHKKVIPGEKFKIDQYISVYVEEVAKESKFSQIMVSRTAPHFLVKLLEQEVPEIREGLIEVKGVAREPGERAKIAVYSHDANIDPVGSCIGVNGSRINNVSKELKDEKIDVILWDENMENFIMNAMAPVRVASIDFNPETGECNVVVPNQQLSLAIGRRGMSARLVANIVQKRINIFSYDDAQQQGIDILWNGNISLEEMNSSEFIANANSRRKFSQNNNRDQRQRQNQMGTNELDLEALRQWQEEIEKAQSEDNWEEENTDTIKEMNDGDEPTSNDDASFELDEIQENLDALNDLEEAFDDEEDESETDLTEEEDYDDYYD